MTEMVRSGGGREAPSPRLVAWTLVAAMACGTVGAGAAAPRPAGARAPSESYDELVALFEDWREFERPPLLDGAPDYTAGRLAEAHAQLPGFLERLHAIDRTGWSVEQQVERYGLRDCVHLVGMISDEELRGWYQHADVFALPSLNVGKRFEGFGLVFLEASAAGLPVIGTRGSGIEEAIIEGQTGLLVDQDDVGALAASITRVLGDEALRARLGAAGRAYAQTQDWSVIARDVAAVYRQGRQV